MPSQILKNGHLGQVCFYKVFHGYKVLNTIQYNKPSAPPRPTSELRKSKAPDQLL